MQQYLDMANKLLEEGKARGNRTETGTIGLFGYQYRVDLSDGFPLLTTKGMSKQFEKIFHELMWFLRGDTNIKYLVDRNVNIWNADAYRWYKEQQLYRDVSPEPLSYKDFIECIKNDDNFAKHNGDLGNVYGKQWRKWRVDEDGSFIDQIDAVIEEIKENPNSRRLIVSAWNVGMLHTMALPPCHVLFQFYVQDGKLSCQLYQRSADTFLGVPFNVASYAWLVHMIAGVTGLEVGEFVHTFGDYHIYDNHIEQMTEQVSREPRPLPQLVLKTKRDAILDYRFEDFELVGYDPHPPLTGRVSVG